MKTDNVLSLIKGFLNKKECRIIRGVHFANGFAVATDLAIIAKCKCEYPVANEDATVDVKTGERIPGNYPDYESLLASYREEGKTVPVKMDTKKVAAFLKAGETVAAVNGYDIYRNAIPIRFGEQCAYFSIKYFGKFFNTLEKYGVDTIRLNEYRGKQTAYAAAPDGSEFLMASCHQGDYTRYVIDLEGGLNDRALLLAELRCRKALADMEGAALETPAMKKIKKMLNVIIKAKELSGKAAPAPGLPEDEIDSTEVRIAELEKELGIGADDATSTNEDAPVQAGQAPDEVNEADVNEQAGDVMPDEREETDGIEDGAGTEDEPARLEEAPKAPDESPEVRTRMLEAIGRNTDKTKKGGDVRPYRSIWRPEPLDRIKADEDAEYCVFCRRERSGKFIRETAPDLTGMEAFERLERFQEAAGTDGVSYSGLAYQIRHRAKGIVHEWHWARNDADAYEPRPVSRKKRLYEGMPREEIARMENLFSLIVAETGGQAAAVIKHMRSCGIRGWEDLTKSCLYRLRDELRETCAPASARTYMATIKGFLARYVDDRGITPEYKEILRNKADKPVKTWLDKDELTRLEGVEPKNLTESLVKARFLIGAYTGMRISDALNVDEANEREGMLSYVSQKTGTEATVPCPEKVRALISYVQENNLNMSLVTYNETIRELCRRAGICQKVKTRRGGENRTGPKWRFVSSHTARISFATNLANLGVPLVKLAGMMGHSSIQMTERYIAGKPVKLSSRAMAYFQ